MIFDYNAQPKERVDRCNLCGRPAVSTPYRDRYGFDIGKTDCPCGLVFLNPRMTKEAYEKFYANGYRPLVSKFHGREINAQTIQPGQRVYAERLAVFLEPHIKGSRTLLDIGGSTGVVSQVLRERFGLAPTILDPSPEEVAQSDPDITRIVGLVEDFAAYLRGEKRWDVVILCQTVDHLLDIYATLRLIRDLVPESGRFFVDFLDFEQTKELKIDHPFNLTRDTMEQYLENCGFLPIDEYESNRHVGYLCRPFSL